MAGRRYDTLKPTLKAAGWACVVVALTAWLGWRLYASGQEEVSQALTDGRAMVLSLAGEVKIPNDPENTLVEEGAAVFPVKSNPAIMPGPVALDKERSLKPAPDPEVTEQTEIGPLPIIGKNGGKPWLAYAHPFTRAGSTPIIAILISEVGLSKETSDAALRLPPPVSLAMSPYAEQARIWTDAARAVGHEVFIDLPLEPADISINDPGPKALLSMHSPKENIQQLRTMLVQTPGVVGVYFSQDERFSANESAAAPIYQFLARRGLLMAIAAGGPAGAQDRMLDQAKTPFVRADMVLDLSADQESIAQQLRTLEAIAVRRGYAFAVGRSYPITLKVVDEWSQAVGKKGIILAPVSALARLKFS